MYIVEPEAQARQDIDKMLTASGWIIQDYDTRNLSESLGVAVREYLQDLLCLQVI